MARTWRIWQCNGRYSFIILFCKKFVGEQKKTYGSYIAVNDQWKLGIIVFDLKTVLLTLRLILMMPVNTETFEKSTGLKISIFSENNF